MYSLLITKEKITTTSRSARNLQVFYLTVNTFISVKLKSILALAMKKGGLKVTIVNLGLIHFIKI